MKKTLGTLAVAVVLMACGSTDGTTDTTTAVTETVTETETATPTPEAAAGPLAQLDALLNSDSGLVDTICSEALHLASVGWPDGVIPGLLSGSAVGTPLLDEYQLAKIEAIPMKTERALAFAIERC